MSFIWRNGGVYVSNGGSFLGPGLLVDVGEQVIILPDVVTQMFTIKKLCHTIHNTKKQQDNNKDLKYVPIRGML